MKMIYGGTPVNSMKVKHYEMDTNDCDMLESDLQAGKTGVAKGRKIVGTGKSFEFAEYGLVYTNFPIPISGTVNIVEIASTIYPIKISIALSDMKNIDFANSQVIGSVIIDNVEYPITTTIEDDLLTLNCDETIGIQIFYGKDNYV